MIRQEPVADTILREGDSVTLVISDGPGPEYSANFELIVPQSGTVIVTITDGKGVKELYREYCFAGERVQKDFIYYGTAQLSITCNNQMIMEKIYEP